MSSAIWCKEEQWELAAVLAMSGATFATSSASACFLSASASETRSARTSQARAVASSSFPCLGGAFGLRHFTFGDCLALG